MEAIRGLEGEGYSISLIGNDIRCQKKERANPDPVKVQQLLQEIRNRKVEAVRYLKGHPLDYDEDIRAVIAEFNSRGICMMDVPETMRKKALRLEEEMTKTANQGNRDKFLKALRQWRNCFN